MLIVGIDEVGRGCIAGPVVACAVLLKSDFTHPEVIDSKKLSEKKRVSLSEIIKKNAVAIGYGVICNQIIDKINILNATKEAMHRALAKLKIDYDSIVIDAIKLKNTDKPFEAHFKAEDKFIQVASASILAKVYRDNLMKKMHLLYPQYNWYENKGYGTKAHIDAIKRFGLTTLHRKTFLKGILDETVNG
ncbi:MAG: ribonuclease HII [Deferribacterales bacterium]